MSAITNLEPRLIWEQFDAITRVPRPSKKEAKIIDFLVDFAKEHQIEYQKDEIGNVVMRKPATPGLEDRPMVILQAHMDMVCEKNSDVEFDFENDPITTRIEDGWVKAEGTTLGADCGIGMAAALAVLLDETVAHSPIECLFTVDEETGLLFPVELKVTVKNTKDTARSKAYDLDAEVQKAAERPGRRVADPTKKAEQEAAKAAAAERKAANVAILKAWAADHIPAEGMLSSQILAACEELSHLNPMQIGTLCAACADAGVLTYELDEKRRKVWHLV